MAAKTKSEKQGKISVGKVPGKVTKIDYREGMTVKQAFQSLELNTDGSTIQRNGEKARLTDKVRAGDTVLAVVKVAGS